MGYYLAFADISVLLDNPSWTIIILPLPTIIFFGAIFRHIIGHDNNNLGIFGKLICAVECILLGCCDFVKGVHRGAVKGLSRCSCSDVRDSDVRDSDEPEVPIASSPPCYKVSPYYLSKQVLLISHLA